MFRKFMDEIASKLSSDDTIKRSELLVGLTSLKRVMDETMKNNSLNLQDMLLKHDGKEVITMLSKHGIKVTTNKEIANLLKDDYSLILDVIDSAINLVEDHLSEIVIQDTITFKQNAILDLVDHTDSIAHFYGELMMLIIYTMNDELKIVYKKKTDDIIDGLETYNTLMTVYRTNLVKVIKDISDLSDTRISENIDALKEVASVKDLSFKLPVNGFNGNPIQALGKWWVDFQLYRADSYSDTKNLVQLKLIQLRDKKENGTVDTNIDSQIEYFEKRIQKLEKKIYSLRKV